MKLIIGEQRKRQVPSGPPVKIAPRKELPALGTRAADAVALDALAEESSAALEAHARSLKAQREAEGIGDSYQERQGSRPEVDAALVGKRLEVLCSYVLEEGGGQELRWAAGVVTMVSDGTNMVPKSKYGKGVGAMLVWDAMYGLEAHECAARLLPTKWNKDSEGAWRFCLD